jgi:uncharacterized membrane protein YbhN (UPF0104 family)
MMMGPFIQKRSPIPYLKILQWILVLAIFAFLGKMVWENWAQVKEASFPFKLFPFILSTLIFMFSYFIQIWAWGLITHKLGIGISIQKTWESWFYSQLGKYLPGKVWFLISRFYFYEREGKAKKTISVALYIETVISILAAGLVSIMAFLTFPEARSIYSLPQWGGVVIMVVLAFLFLHPKILEKVINWVLIRLRKEPIKLSISYPDILQILLVCLLSWGVGGVGFTLFVSSLWDISSAFLFFLTGALAISNTLGLLTLFAPSGLGVREGVLVYFLSMLMPGSMAVILSVLTRLWTTLIEIGLIGMVYLFGRLRKGLGKEHPHV